MSAWKEYKEKNGSTPFDLLNPNTEYATEGLASERLNLCKACPELIHITNQCKNCGCFMNLKTKIKASICPLGKW